MEIHYANGLYNLYAKQHALPLKQDFYIPQQGLQKYFASVCSYIDREFNYLQIINNIILKYPPPELKITDNDDPFGIIEAFFYNLNPVTI